MINPGDKVVCLYNFDEERVLYGLNYPLRGDVLTVLMVTPHPIPKWVTLHFDCCEIGLCSRNFVPVEDRGDTFVEEFTKPSVLEDSGEVSLDQFKYLSERR